MDSSTQYQVLIVGLALLLRLVYGLFLAPKDMSVWISWPGIALGVVLVAVAIASNRNGLLVGPFVLYAAGMLCVIGAVAWQRFL